MPRRVRGREQQAFFTVWRRVDPRKPRRLRLIKRRGAKLERREARSEIDLGYEEMREGLPPSSGED